jgi:hypothetical protein
MRRSRAFPPHALPRGPTMVRTTPLGDDAVVLHLGPDEKLRRDCKRAPSAGIKCAARLALVLERRHRMGEGRAAGVAPGGRPRDRRASSSRRASATAPRAVSRRRHNALVETVVESSP